MFAEEISFETITDALNYTGNRYAITKLIITGNISGDDYSDASEWSKFRTLDDSKTGFPNIKEVEILTDQDIPDADYLDQVVMIALFYNSNFYHSPPNWLKSFSAPNIKKIGMYAFMRCEGLVSVNFPNATTIEDRAFSYTSLESVYFPNVITIGGQAFNECRNLVSINCPLVTGIRNVAFFECTALTSVSFGTGFTEPTEIIFGVNVFALFPHYSIHPPPNTPNIDLVLGEYALPEFNEIEKSWNSDNNLFIDDWSGDTTNYPADYIWKSISIYDGIHEPTLTNLQLFPNPTDATTTLMFDIETAGNLQITLTDLLGAELFEIDT
jgi:hypothetical protein